MSRHDLAEEQLYTYAMELFLKAGHVATTQPEYSNHSAEQFIYFDNSTEVALTRVQRSQFSLFNNVSRLFTENQCAFFSINLMTTKGCRSQAAHDIHTMIHPIIGTKGTVCLFHYDNEVMLSFMGFGLHCILSDWYPIDDDCDSLLEKLDIANVCTDRGYDYFTDMIYMLARDYYLSESPSTYELLPINFINEAGIDDIDREEINQYVQEQLLAPMRIYGDDYVEYDESFRVHDVDIGADLDFMLLDLDDEDDDPFGETVESDEDVFEEDGYFDEGSESNGQDEYEFDDMDPEIFRDPTLMVKWLKQIEKKVADNIV